MSFVVARMQKVKSGNLVGVGNHNQRNTDNHSNKDIDVERSHLNYDLVNRTENYKTDIQQFINDNKSSSRAVRKDAVLINEWIITSDNPFFKDKDDKEIKDFFDTAKSYFADKFGDNNIRYAQVHLDETTPHMHLGIVPFNAEHKLTAKTVFNRQALQAVQDELPQYLNERGFELERGEKGSEHKNLTVPEYKVMKERLKELNAEKAEIEQVLNTAKLPTVKREPVMERKGLSLAKKPSETKIIVNKDDLERLQTIARANLDKKAEFDSMKISRNVTEEHNKELRLEVMGLKRELKAVKQELSATVEPLKEKLRFADSVIQHITERFTDNIRSLDHFWERFQQRMTREQKNSDRDRDELSR
ncbi:MobV family relaxase [Aerococcus viridans]